MLQNYTEEPLTIKEVDQLIKTLMSTIINNSEYFYTSTVDYKYSRLTTQGQEYIVKVLNHLLPLLAEAEREDLQERARDLTLTILSDKETK